jgi:hypothetical protein
MRRHDETGMSRSQPARSPKQVVNSGKFIFHRTCMAGKKTFPGETAAHGSRLCSNPSSTLPQLSPECQHLS